jgi:glutamine amidotransferase
VTIGILNYGVGNVGSLLNMFKKIGEEAQLVSQPDEVSAQSRLVLPGVGSFDHAMTRLSTLGFVAPLNAYVTSGKRLLGICLGMQLLVNSSAEGELPGLGFIDGHCEKFEPSPRLRVPHMGWSSVQAAQRQSQRQTMPGIEPGNRFYFAHSYYVTCPPDNVLATSTYGHEFVSMITRGNITGAQFHPEKSHVFGMSLLSGWSALS